MVELAWSDTPELVIEEQGGRLLARAHPGLSDRQVQQACSQLGDMGDAVYRAWRRTVSA